MTRWFDRALDRELGPAPAGQGPARDPWLRDWPLLLGLLLSAALVVGSMAVRGSEAKPAEPATTASLGAGVAGEVVDVGEEPSAAAEPAGKAAKAKSKKKKAAGGSPTARGGGDAASEPTETDSGSAAAEPQATGGSGSTGGGSSRGRSAPTPGSTDGPAETKAVPGKIVNVTGTSAAFTNGPLSYVFKAPTHSPTVGKPWVLSIGAKRSGAPLRGTVRIDILHQGKVVATAAKGALSNGRFAHRFIWPTEAVGHPVTVRTTVIGGGFQQSFLFDVKVKAAG